MRDSDLHAYVDGQLDSARRIEVETWLAEDEEAARRVEAYRTQNATLHSLFDSILKEPADGRLVDLGERLGQRLDAAAARRSWWSQPGWRRLAAAVTFIAAGLGAGWLGRGQVVTVPVAQAPAGQPTLQAFAEEATQAHTFYAHSRFEVEMGADNQDALNNWLSERLGRSVFGPDLGAIGYRLIGGRSLPAEGGAVAQYMYETEGGNRLTLFVGTPKADQQSAFSFVKHGEIASFYWAEGVLSYALVGRFERDQLMSIAQTVHQKLKSGPSPRPAPAPPQAAPEAKPAPAPAEQMVPPPPAGGPDQERPKAS
ncbi:MAG: anti-sigma factor [Rhodospirillaceae bacterium]